MRKGRVRVSVIRAANLRAGDSDGLSDPYMKLKLGGMTEVSAVVKKTLNPRFDWDYTFGFEDRTFAFAATLKIEAWDHDFGLSLDDKLGHGTLRPFTEYEFRVVAANLLGLSKETDPLVVRTAPTSKTILK